MAFALDLAVRADVAPPALVAPAPGEASFGRVAGRVDAGTDRVVVFVDGERRTSHRVHGTHFELHVSLPPRDVRIRVVARDMLGNRAGTVVEPVLGLPATGTPVTTQPHEDRALARKVDALVRDFRGIAAVYVENLATGAGAASNALARFPAASTLKVPIAVEVLRLTRPRPPPRSALHRELRRMLVHSDNEAANALLTRLGGSHEAGAQAVSRTLGALGLRDSVLYDGFMLAASGPIPLTRDREPAFFGKRTSAWDLARLHRFLHLAADGRGPLPRLDGAFTPADARYLLYLLAHSADVRKLDRYAPDDAIVAHKGGWVDEARHDGGLFYTPDTAFVVAVMTWNGAGVGDRSDELAGRVARVALEHFRGERPPWRDAPRASALGL